MNGKWLNDLHINAAQQLLKSQFSKYGGFQSTLTQLTTPLKQLDKCIQILHVHDNHWAVITTLGCDLQENKIRYYDSSYTELLYNTEMIISRLMPEKPEIKVDVMKLTKQIGSNDCGLYAIAIATALAYEVDPSTLLFEQNEMRTHLANCFMRQHLTQFPTKKTRRTTNSILSTVTVYVCPACKLTENGIDMVQCEQCEIWYHDPCVPNYDKDKEWFCPTCISTET